jgi:hypothetical protein
MRSETRGCRITRNARAKRGRGVTTMRGRVSDGRSGTSSPVMRRSKTPTCAMTASAAAMGMYLATASQRLVTSSMISGASPRCWLGSRLRAAFASATATRATLSCIVATSIPRTMSMSRRDARIGRRLAHRSVSMTTCIVELIRRSATSRACCARRYGGLHSGPRVLSRRPLRRLVPPLARRGARAEPKLVMWENSAPCRARLSIKNHKVGLLATLPPIGHAGIYGGWRRVIDE